MPANQVQIAAGFRRLRERFPKAVARAVNRSATSARAHVARAIAADLRVKVGDVRERITIREATAAEPKATLYANAKRLSLVEMNGGRLPGPVPSRGRGRVSVRGTRYEGAFAGIVGKGSHKGVFKRVGAMQRKSAGAWSKNLPMTELHGPSIWKAFEKQKDAAVAHATQELRKNLAHELKFAQSQSGE